VVQIQSAQTTECMKIEEWYRVQAACISVAGGRPLSLFRLWLPLHMYKKHQNNVNI
jgi:hypothetical protein